MRLWWTERAKEFGPGKRQEDEDIQTQDKGQEEERELNKQEGKDENKLGCHEHVKLRVYHIGTVMRTRTSHDDE